MGLGRVLAQSLRVVLDLKSWKERREFTFPQEEVIALRSPPETSLFNRERLVKKEAPGRELVGDPGHQRAMQITKDEYHFEPATGKSRGRSALEVAFVGFDSTGCQRLVCKARKPISLSVECENIEAEVSYGKTMSPSTAGEIQSAGFCGEGGETFPLA
jgi:hypothetical protein